MYLNNVYIEYSHILTFPLKPSYSERIIWFASEYVYLHDLIDLILFS